MIPRFTKSLLAIVCVCTLSLATWVFANDQREIVSAEDISWTALNPARGDQSPRAGTLWGDRTAELPTGFLVEFVDGFSSPPHIHNITYRGAVISGTLHNDDANADPMWMPPGSFWTQPGGQAHITSAKGKTNRILVEIDQGPYLVKPIEQAFDTGERPLNIHAQNLVWVDVPIGNESEKGAEIAYLWGETKPEKHRGTFLKIPAGKSTELVTQGDTFRAVIIAGSIRYLHGENLLLGEGSYFGTSYETKHKLETQEETILYIRSDNTYQTKLN